MLMRITIHIILAVFSTYLVFEYYRTFLEFRSNRAKIAGIAVGYSIWQMTSLIVLAELPAWIRLLISVLCVLMVSICFDGEIPAKIVFAVIYNAVWMLLELLLGSCILLTGHDYAKYETLGSIISKAALFLLIKALQTFFHHKNMKFLSWKEHALLMLFPTGSMFFTYHLFMLSVRNGTQWDHLVSFAAFAAVLLSNILVFVIYIKLSDNMELEKQNSLYQLELDLCNEHMREKENAMEQMQKLRHDLRYHMIFGLELLNHKEYDKLRNFMENLMDLKLTKGFSVADTGNFMIDTLINFKYETAKQYGIDFRVKLYIPTGFSMANPDLCIILGNALDNAIEANMGGNVEKPYITLNMKYDRGNLILILENSFDGIVCKKEDGTVCTRKKDKENHGIGMRSIQNVLEKYNGFMNTEISEKRYKLTVIMYALGDEIR